MDDTRLKYEIAYDSLQKRVIAYPQWKGPRANTAVIGSYKPGNARANLNEYVDELGDAVRESLTKLSQLDFDPVKVLITPLDGTHEVMVRLGEHPLHILPVDGRSMEEKLPAHRKPGAKKSTKKRKA